MAFLLDLDTLVERPTIRIDGVPYELRTPDELSVLDLQRLQTWGRRFQVLVTKADISEEEATELGMMADKIVALVVVDLAIEVRGRLSFVQKAKIGEVFTRLSPQATAPVTGGGRKRTSARRSAGSNGTTAAIPSGG